MRHFRSTREGRFAAALTVLRWSRALCHRHRGSLLELGLPPEREGGLRIPERPADREDREPDPREEEGDPDHDPEQADLLASWLMFSALVSAVSLIQTCRAPFCTGCFVVGSIAANSALLVPPPTSSWDLGVPGFAV